MYGTQTDAREENTDALFENDVKMYGTQTFSDIPEEHTRLRMM